ncbi:MAG TPA: cytochrome c [Bacteroidia bacterium]|jgi:mono/diheme cytochrome c family protein|nr:cytochrome c [Bacteroidia bacterium]
MKLNYKNIRSILSGITLAVVIIGLTSCGKRDENSPGVEFMPDMYRSPSVEVYGTSSLNGDEIYSTQFLPAKGSIARGYIPYAYPNTPEGYEAAGLNLKNPIPYSDKVLAQGEALYAKNCIHCHGASGAGDGKVGLKLPGAPPAYSDAAHKNLPEGKIFHSITYGKNLMGAHASILTQEERWKLVYYVQKLQGPKTTATDSTKVAVAEVKKEVKK